MPKRTSTHPRRFRRLVAGAFTASAVLSGLVPSDSGAAPAPAFRAPTWERQIGGPGHAFVYPWGMATAIDGTILTSDYNNFTIRRFSTAGEHLGDISGPGAGPGQTNQPYQIAVDPTDGRIYLADVLNGEIDQFDADGVWQKAIIPSAPDLGPYVYVPRIAVNSRGWLYVVSSHNITPDWPHRVLVYDRDGTLIDEFGANGTGNGEFKVMRGIGIGPDDEVYVADVGNRRVQVFDTDGNFVRAFGQGGTGPGKFGYDMRGIAVDRANGWVYVVDASEGHVEKFDTTGKWLATVGAPGADPGQLGGPREATVGNDGTLYVADYTYWRINAYGPDGTFLRDLPSPAVPAPDGGFNLAEDVAVNRATGSVYVSDTFNHRIQEFDAAGAFVRGWGFRGRGAPDAMDYPRGIAVDQTTGNVWLNNTRSADVKAYTPGAGFITSFGRQGSEPENFFYARGIHVGAGGRVLVPDSFNMRLKITDQRGTNLMAALPCGAPPPRTTPQTLLGGCTGVTEDAAGNIYAASVAENLIYKWNAGGQLLTKFGSAPGGNGRVALSQPYDVVVSGDRLYVTEVGANRVTVMGLDGRLIGRFGSGGTPHGRFRAPSGIAVDAAGRIYVMDKGNERVEVFKP